SGYQSRSPSSANAPGSSPSCTSRTSMSEPGSWRRRPYPPSATSATPSGEGSNASRNQPSSASARSRAAHRPCCPGGYARASASNRVRSASALAIALEGVWPHLAGADPHHAVDVGDPELAVADLAGAGGLRDRVHHAVHVVVVDDDLDPHLRDEVHLVLGAPVHLRVAALAPEPLDVARR